MTAFTSDVKTIPHNDEPIFLMLSDMSNMERIKDRIPHDKISRFTFDRDRCSFEINPIGKIEFQIVDREPNKMIRFETISSPIPINLRIQLDQTKDKITEMQLTMHADLNPFLKPMVSKPLQEALDKISDMIATLPYE